MRPSSCVSLRRYSIFRLLRPLPPLRASVAWTRPGHRNSGARFISPLLKQHFLGQPPPGQHPLCRPPRDPSQLGPLLEQPYSGQPPTGQPPLDALPFASPLRGRPPTGRPPPWPPGARAWPRGAPVGRTAAAPQTRRRACRSTSTQLIHPAVRHAHGVHRRPRRARPWHARPWHAQPWHTRRPSLARPCHTPPWRAWLQRGLVHGP
jgi:hypothetical protein